MRIHTVDAIAIDIPLRRNFGGSTYAVLKRSTVVTRLRTDDGLVGLVYNGDNREHGPEIVRLIRDDLAPILKEQDPAEVERIWSRLFALSHASRDRKLLMEAIACVDCAIWDVLGRARGQSVCAMLGGQPGRRLPIISIGGYYREGKTLADIGREMESYREAGMAGCKFKVGGLAPEADAERVRAARAAAGPGFVLAVDANRGWAVEDAARFAHLVEPLDIAWFEEPVPPEDLDGYLQVKRTLTMPISGGEAEYARFGFRDLVARRCVDILQPDICACGGFTEALRIGALANTWGVTVYPHVWGSAVGLHASMQWAASLPPNPFALVPGELWFELDRTANPFREGLAAEPLKRAGAIIEVPQRPGLGLEVDRAVVERHAVTTGEKKR